MDCLSVETRIPKAVLLCEAVDDLLAKPLVVVHGHDYVEAAPGGVTSTDEGLTPIHCLGVNHG